MTNSESVHELQEAMKTAKDRRDFERYQAVFLSLSGYPHKEIAVMIGRCSHSVGHYVKAYKQNGLDGLKRTSPPGKAFRLTMEQRNILKETVAYKTPDEVGFPSRFNWTLSLAVQFIQREWGESYTQKGVSKLLHSLGLSYTRPTYTMKKADPEKQQHFQEETFPTLKKS